MTKKPVPLIALLITLSSSPIFVHATDSSGTPFFNRISTFSAVSNVPKDRKVSKASVSEIVAASGDGMVLAYTDSEQKAVGLVDIRNPKQPKPLGLIDVGGEPTSVVMSGRYAFVAVDQTKDLMAPKGSLISIDLKNKSVVARCDLGGQTDSVAYDQKTKKLVLAIENQRDESLNKGALPQMPAGYVAVIPVKDGLPSCGLMQKVDVRGIATVSPDDPEPEFVKVNAESIAAVTMQENNHIALIDLKTNKLINHFSAGAVDLMGIDSKSDGVITLIDNLTQVPREPDAVAWLDNNRLVTANEGDYKGGSRGFSIFHKNGTLEYDSGNLLERLSVHLGHYPEKRSRAKGAEPEGVEVGTYGKDRLIFVGAERASLVYVFKDEGSQKAPTYLQALPTGTAPEGLLAIPQRNLLVVASENDKGARAGLMIYQRGALAPEYPSLISGSDPWGQPIPWGAISGATSERGSTDKIWVVTDSAYKHTRLLRVDTTRSPARIIGSLTVTKDGIPQSLDGEGIVHHESGGFWMVSEGNPTDKKAPTQNQLLRLSNLAEVLETIELPVSVSEKATRFGFEGVTVIGSGNDEMIVIAVQREWKDDPKGHAKILFYKPVTKEWRVAHFPLQSPATEDSWVGLSEITAVSETEFVVIERDNQFGDNAYKTLQRFSINGLNLPLLGSSDPIPVLKKTLERDLVPDMKKTNGNVLDKVESFAELTNGQRFIITDNDGVDGSSGETMFLRIR
jgi:hypothetical protein